MDFVSRFVGGWSGCHHIEELVEFDLAAAVLVEFSDHGVDCLSLGLDTERVDCGFELSGVDGSSSVVVEEVEASLNLHHLLDRDILVGELAWVEAGKSTGSGYLIFLGHKIF